MKGEDGIMRDLEKEGFQPSNERRNEEILRSVLMRRIGNTYEYHEVVLVVVKSFHDD